MNAQFDLKVFRASIEASNIWHERWEAGYRSRKPAEVKLANEIIAEAALAAQRLNANGWPDGTFVALRSKQNFIMDKHAKGGRLLHIFGEAWCGDVDASLIIGQNPLWLGDDGFLYERTCAGGVIREPERAVPFGRPRLLHVRDLVQWRDGFAILATLRALGTT